MGRVSMPQGKGSQLHNRREYEKIGKPIPDNIDVSKSSENITLVDKDIKQAYQEIFGEALEKYNAKQKRADRKIEDYCDHITQPRGDEPQARVGRQGRHLPCGDRSRHTHQRCAPADGLLRRDRRGEHLPCLSARPAAASHDARRHLRVRRFHRARHGADRPEHRTQSGPYVRAGAGAGARGLLARHHRGKLRGRLRLYLAGRVVQAHLEHHARGESAAHALLE